MLYQFIEMNFAPLVGLLFLFFFLLTNTTSDKAMQRIFILLALLESVEMIAYSAELWTATFSEPTPWRILLSAIGYSIRPVLLLCIVQLAARFEVTDRKFLILSIPALVNIVGAFSAFLTGIVYSYDAENRFVRGPLGYMPHVIMFFYLICILVLSVKRSARKRKESAIVWAICVVVVFATVAEAVLSVRSFGRTAIVLSTLAYYLYFQTLIYKEDIQSYMEQTIQTQKEHLREMNVIGVLANEYVTVCYVDGEKDVVTPYRMDPFIERHYGEILRSGVSFEQVFMAYVTQNILEEDRAFFLELADLQEMLSYLRQNGNISRKYRVLRDGNVLYCEMRAELVRSNTETDDIVFGFSNNDTRVRKEMIYQSAVQQELDKVEEAKRSLSGIAELARQLQDAIGDKFSEI